MRTNRPYVQLDPAVIEQARQMDLLSYLQRYEPNNLKRVASNVYCTKEHDSLKISNGKWYWWSRGFGGVSALDYLIKVKEYSFVEAVELLTGITADWKPPPVPVPKDEPKELLLPPKNKDGNRVTEYLFGRGIDLSIIQDCIADGTILKAPSITMLYLSERTKAEHPSMPPTVARLEALLRATLLAATSGIRSDFWQTNRVIPCIYLKPLLIYCPTPPI